MAKYQRALTIVATGVSQASSGASAGTTLPNDASGGVAREVLVTATVAAFFRMGVGAQTCVATDLLIIPGDARLLTVPRGHTNFAVLQQTGAGVVIVSPVEA